MTAASEAMMPRCWCHSRGSNMLTTWLGAQPWGPHGGASFFITAYSTCMQPYMTFTGLRMDWLVE